ncbi:unnamed protein product, partial [Scytosiphon promiscuus]
RRPASWRYHPRPRNLPRNVALRRPASLPNQPGGTCARSDNVPAPSLQDDGADIMLRAAGVHGGNTGSGVDCAKIIFRSRSCSTTANSCPPLSLQSGSPLVTERDQQHHQQRPKHPQEELPEGFCDQEEATAAACEIGFHDPPKSSEFEEADAESSSIRRSCSGDGAGESEPSASTPTATAAESDKGRSLVPRLLFFSSLRRQTRQREKSSPISDRQDSVRHVSPPPLSASRSPSPATALLPKTSPRTAKRRNRSSYRFGQGTRGKALVATTLACCAMLQPAQVSALYNTSLTFDPPEAGYPTEIAFTFTPMYGISAGKFIRLHLAGFTRGERNGTAGEDLGFGSEDDEGNEALAWPSDTFRGWWSEGTPEEEYEDSIFNLYTERTLVADETYTVIIDRSSSLKSNCGHPADFSAFYAWVDDETTFYKMFGKVDYAIEAIERIPMSCYVAPASLTFDPPLPRTKTHITVAFQPARDLVAGDNITVNLKGFTSGEANGTLGADFEPGELLLANGSAWLAAWEEGTFVEGKPGYEGSMLRLEATAPVPAGELHEVIVYRSNGIRAQCGMAENGTSSTISVVSASDPPWNATGEFTYTQTMGPGCRDLSYCSDRGECDYCLQRCNCPEGFGSLSELEDVPEIARTCSEMTCPFGVSWAPVLSGHPRLEPDDSHTRAECSNMGTCVRSFGLCMCEEGFEGRACERYACPNGCSGNGACRNMREMGFMRAAKPLVNASTDDVSTRGDSAEGFEVAYGWDSPEGTATWESRSVFGCVCDSSWEVGLGPGQTQEAEYFGPDCSMLHCPTGNDPDTEVDETDCSYKTADGGRGVGSAGNLCHVDCSNRGICDYRTGVCNCFDGYHGQA